ncbi:MAG TPA: hypothetical protein VJS92_16290 [Candidatus Polarisedimenticolaceae bacterium]|nr:hypothetical protein [Candidatus Polarisedimenticolaceae bacterium]
MICPQCRSEYRAGFTQCATCGTDLVHELSTPQVLPAPPRPTGVAPARAAGPLLDFCGFLSLDEARDARERLREQRIRSDIVIRDAPGEDPGTVLEEYWLRVEQTGFALAASLLGYDAAEEPVSVACSECGHAVAADASRCPKCGASFEEA